MATIRRTVHWTVLADEATTLRLIGEAVEPTDFTVSRLGPDGIQIDVPRAIVKNRWAATITGTPSPGTQGTRVEWVVEGLGNKHYELVASLAEGMPEGSIYDHGIAEAAAKIPGGKLFGRREIAHLSNLLDYEEHVHVAAVGNLGGKLGLVALTDHRLMFVEKSIGNESLTEFDLGAINALSLGKRIGGEALSVSHSGRTAVINQLGHGLGDSIVRKYRELKAAAAAPAAPAAAAPDPLEQLDRLAALRDRGVLTEEEFQTQKAQLLAKM